MSLLYRHFYEKTRIMLDALDEVPLADLDPATRLIPLHLVGDAVRLGIETPGPAMRKVEALSDDALRAALRELCAETATWSLPSDPVEDPDGYAWAVRRRDEAESAIVGARRAAIPRGTLVYAFEEVRAYRTLVEAMDFTCGGRIGRREVRRALGERGALVKRNSWAVALK